MTFPQVGAGEWLLSAYNSAGNLLARTQVTVTERGVQVANSPLVLTGVREIAESQVNSTSGNHTDPAVAIDSRGNYVIVWTGPERDGGSFTDIYARRYNAAGEPQGQEFVVNANHTEGNQYAPDIAMDSNGNFVVTWTSQEATGSTDIHAQRFNAAGDPQGSAFVVNTNTTYSQQNPAIAMDSDGDFVITWESFDDNMHTDIHAQLYYADGRMHGSEFTVNDYTTDSQADPDVAMDSTGNFAITWSGAGQDGEQSDIYAKIYDANGIPRGLGFAFPVNSYSTSSQSHPAIAMDRDGDFVITWESLGQDGDLGGIYARRYSHTGTPQGGEIPVNSYTTGYQSSPAVAMDGAGNFLIAWVSNGQDGDSSGIYAQRYDTLGQAQCGELRGNISTTGDQTHPAIAINSSGDSVAVYQEEEGRSKKLVATTILAHALLCE